MQLPCDGDPPATSSSASAGGRTGVLGEFSVYVGNLDPETAVADMEELLYELFLQAGPLSRVYIPFDKDTGKHKCYGFVEFLHQESVPYTIKLMHGIQLCGRLLNVRMVTQSHTNTTSNSNSVTMATTSVVTMTSTSDVAMATYTATSANPFFLALKDNPPPLMLPGPPPLPLSALSPPPLFPCDIPPPFPPPPIVPPPFPPPIELPPFPPPVEPGLILPPLPKQNSFPPPLFPSAAPFGPPAEPSPFRPPHPDRDQPPHSTPPPLFPPEPPPRLISPPHSLPSSTSLPMGGTNIRLHESRLHSRDHPPWMRNNVKERISQYHLQELQYTLSQLKETMGDNTLDMSPSTPFISCHQSSNLL